MSAAKSFHDHLLTHVTPTMLVSMLQESFFLPADIIETAELLGWKIPAINVVDNREFWESFDLLADNANHLTMQPSYEVLKAARRIGVSVRRKENGEGRKVFVICKLWMD